MNGRKDGAMAARGEIRPPRRFQRIIDRVCERDRQYFERHPDAGSYVRDYVPGETWPYALPQGSRICVTTLGPGVRAREQLSEVPR